MAISNLPKVPVCFGQWSSCNTVDCPDAQDCYHDEEGDQ